MAQLDCSLSQILQLAVTLVGRHLGWLSNQNHALFVASPKGAEQQRHLAIPRNIDQRRSRDGQRATGLEGLRHACGQQPSDRFKLGKAEAIQVVTGDDNQLVRLCQPNAAAESLKLLDRELQELGANLELSFVGHGVA